MPEKVMGMSSTVSHQSPEVILIAEDDMVLRTLLNRLLQSAGYCVEQAKDGIEALEKATQLHPSVILLDGLMPGLNGIEVCQQLRAVESEPRSLVIMVTAVDAEDYITQAFEAGADDYITKPIRWPVLKHRLHRLIATRKAEQNVLQERNQLRTLIDNLPDYIFIKDTEGRFLVSNLAHARSVQTTVDKLVGKTAFDFFPPELATQFHADDLTVMQTGVPAINLERDTVDDSGNPKKVLTTKVPLYDGSGTINGLVGISRDITERKRAEEQLQKLTNELTASNKQLQHLYDQVSALEHLKTDMLRMASHDLRAPLTQILGYGYLLNTSQPLTEDSRTYLDSIVEAAHRMKKIVEDVLSVERIQASDNSALLTTDLRVLCEAVFLENKTQAQQKQQAFTYTVTDQPVHVQADSGQLYEAITNLVNNAIKYTPQGGTIDLRLEMHDGIAQLEVKDTGYGIPDYLQKQLFQPFFRAKTEETSNIDGTGLGLHLVKNVIERHHGQMQFASTYGEGSSFGFQLALSDEPAKIAEEAQHR
ncbi:MAG: response regulator [Chloroflexota bacterium]